MDETSYVMNLEIPRTAYPIVLLTVQLGSPPPPGMVKTRLRRSASHVFINRIFPITEMH